MLTFSDGRSRRTLKSAGAAVALALAACDGKPPVPPAVAVQEGDFDGSWSAAGARRSISLGSDRSASAINLSGTMLLTGPGRPALGFRAEIIGLTDTQTGFVGRAVWTDAQGEQVFSELTGEGTDRRNRIAGTIIGGTGRYRGAGGAYEFAWEYVIELEDGSIQGRAVGLKGHYKLTQHEPADARRSGQP